MLYRAAVVAFWTKPYVPSAFSCYLERAALLSTLVVVEHKRGQIAAATYNAVSASAQVSGSNVTALVSGHNIAKVSQQIARLEAISKVLEADHPCLEHGLAEPLAQILTSIQKRHGYEGDELLKAKNAGRDKFSHIMAPSSTFGRDFLPRAAAMLDVQQISDVVKILDANTFERPIYAGNAVATVKYVGDGPRLLTVRSTSFPPSATERAQGGDIETLDAVEMLGTSTPQSFRSEWVEEEVRQSERPDLGSARIVVGGGRALKNAENFKQLEDLADLLGGAVGASRAAVDAGWVPNDLQVGQTGKVIAPDLYIALGISGAIQHLAGMKDSKTIVAINNDPQAPIFEVSDYGLIQDVFTALPELKEAILKLKSR